MDDNRVHTLLTETAEHLRDASARAESDAGRSALQAGEKMLRRLAAALLLAAERRDDDD